MSKEDPKEHIKTYETFCAPRFIGIEEDIKDTTKVVNDLNAIITNGLVDKVDRLEKQSRWIIRLLISLLLLVIASTVTLYSTNNREPVEVHHEISN